MQTCYLTFFNSIGLSFQARSCSSINWKSRLRISSLWKMNYTTKTPPETSDVFYTWPSSVDDVIFGAGNTTFILNKTESDKYFEAAVLVPVVWTVLIVIGLLGNGLVVYVLVRYGERKATNCYILNLALTDLAFIMVSVPFTMTYYVMTHWIFGSSLCKLQMYMVYVSMPTLAGPSFNIKTVFLSMEIFTMNTRRSWDRLMFIMGVL